ncbi:SRPBCC family protein [Streptomyces sp. DSM 15324]|uniref:SRPBCC family protein n=1 Tax=Streptomyces sp. DSM 15324 TaxID=1739111 RepID=UPI0007465B48|nr:SRPBCC family protein [Streptomyces sp. DSM 15324]KUO07285.1 hypothetical protein AQJ58_36765 [Streptomyces sp. DSM 15324]
MSTIDYATVIDAEADRVWGVLRRFGDIATWFPAVTQSAIEDGLPQSTVGSVRSMVLSDGNPLRERLLSMDDGNRTLSYGFENASMPYDDFVLTVQLVPLDDGPRTFIRWTAHFDVQPQHDRETNIRALRDLITEGDASLHAFFRDGRDH